MPAGNNNSDDPFWPALRLLLYAAWYTFVLYPIRSAWNYVFHKKP
jgi:hypothetical protein